MDRAAKPDDKRSFLWTCLLATTLGGLSVAVLDLLYVATPLSGANHDLGLLGRVYLLCLGTLGGFMIAVPACVLAAVLILIGRRRPMSMRNPGIVCAAALAAAAFCYQNLATFDGPGIRDHALIIPIKVAFFAGGAILLWFAIRICTGLMARLRRGPHWKRVAFAVVLIGTALGFYWIDATYRRKHYANLHLQLAEAVFIVVSLAFLALLAGPGRGRRRWRLALALLLFILVSPLVRLHARFPAQRTAVALNAVNLSQWMWAPERLLARVLPLEEGFIADVSHIVSARSREGRLAPEVERRLDELVPGRRAMNLVIVSLDTVRADHVSFNGYERPTTPFCDGFARDAVVFEPCYSQYPTSSYEFSSFFTSRYASCAPVEWATKGISQEEPPDRR
jgi:hypothetical protein